MKTVHQILSQRLHERKGLLDPKPLHAGRLLTESDLENQWSKEFEILMRNRLMMGAIRYGPFGSSNKKKFDCIGSAIQRLKLYQTTGNTEHLVDAANLCLVEFVEGSHPKKHFGATDDGIHCKPL